MLFLIHIACNELIFMLFFRLYFSTLNFPNHFISMDAESTALALYAGT